MSILKRIRLAYKSVWHWIDRKQKKTFLIILFLTIISSFSEALSVGLVIPFLTVLLDVNILLDNKYTLIFINKMGLKNFDNIRLYVTVIFLFSILVSGLLRVTLIHTNLRLSQRIRHNLSCYIYINNLYLDYEESIKRNSSELVSIIKSKTVSVASGFFLEVSKMLSSIIICTIILILLFTINFKIASGCFFVFGLFYLIITLFTKARIVLYSKTLSELDPKSIKLLNEGFGVRKDIILNNAHLFYQNLFKQADYIITRIGANIQIIASIPRIIIETFTLIILIIAGYTLSITVNSMVSIIPIFAAFILAAQKLLPQIQQIYASWILICESLESVNDVIIELDGNNISHKQSVSKKMPFKSHIEFKGIQYSYANDANPIFKGFSIKINKGDKIGLIGDTGSGKSTFIDIFMGLLMPNKGQIIVDNTKLIKNNINNWQLNISHVPQFIFLADITILENIAIGISVDKINFKLVVEAAKKAQIHDVIEKWSEGYNTIIGEGGVKLSGGQRQRIGLARCFYRKKDLIILDEGTSALDTTTEKKVLNKILSSTNDNTVIICTHRLDTLNRCDYIIEIKNGNLSKK